MLNKFLDQEIVAKLAEVDMIIADLDRANTRIVTLEHRNVPALLSINCSDLLTFPQEILRAEIETTRSGTETSER